MMITLYMPSLNIVEVASTETGLRKGLSYGRVGGFSVEDPFLQGEGKPKTVMLSQDPSTGQAIEPVYAYVYEAGTPFTSSIRHPRILGAGVKDLSLEQGRIGEANQASGAVFVVAEGSWNGESVSYIENATATRNWSPDAVLSAAGDANTRYIGSGKIMFVREGCWWCHTLLPEETQDWQVFGVPPRLGDYNSESPTAFGSDRKAPDLLHVGSRNSSREWMMMHFFNPRLVQPHSIMPRYDYLWGDNDAAGNRIDFVQWRNEYNAYVSGARVYPPEVPEPAADSEARYLIDFVLSLK
ncbi:MAG: cbb3-type cytochrome c oxidase subunit II [Gammaproteobacteria bacterium]|nr:cbb3-type cytochrome c oxidase subunit II [Gammaproteobacteria bacterium]